MNLLPKIIFFSLVGSVFSLIGGILLLTRKKLADSVQHFFLPFAAGALLATAFFDLLPEAQEAAGPNTNVFSWTLIGILIFYLIENLISWFHYHPEKAEKAAKPVAALIIIGDTLHNFLDGIAIGATFLVDPKVGIITTLAVASHEIPQEIGDFAILLSAGFGRVKTLMVNIFSALATLGAALMVYFVGRSFEGILPLALPLTAGFFIYIALSDLVPEIHHGHKRSYIFLQSIVLVGGLVLVWQAVRLLEG